MRKRYFETFQKKKKVLIELDTKNIIKYFNSVIVCDLSLALLFGHSHQGQVLERGFFVNIVHQFSIEAVLAQIHNSANVQKTLALLAKFLSCIKVQAGDMCTKPMGKKKAI